MIHPETREFRGDRHYGILALAVGILALLFSAFLFGSARHGGPWFFVGIGLSLPALLGALVLIFRAYDAFARRIIIDASGLSIRHHSHLLVHLPWSEVQGLDVENGPTPPWPSIRPGTAAMGRRRYRIRTASDTVTLAGLEDMEELVSLVSQRCGRPWQPPGPEAPAGREGR